MISFVHKWNYKTKKARILSSTSILSFVTFCLAGYTLVGWLVLYYSINLYNLMLPIFLCHFFLLVWKYASLCNDQCYAVWPAVRVEDLNVNDLMQRYRCDNINLCSMFVSVEHSLMPVSTTMTYWQVHRSVRKVKTKAAFLGKFPSERVQTLPYR